MGAAARCLSFTEPGISWHSGMLILGGDSSQCTGCKGAQGCSSQNVFALRACSPVPWEMQDTESWALTTPSGIGVPGSRALDSASMISLVIQRVSKVKGTSCHIDFLLPLSSLS